MTGRGMRHTTSMRAPFAGLLALALAGVAGPACAEIVQGTLLLQWGDPQGGAGQAMPPAKFVATLVADDGKRHRLDTAQALRAADNLYALANKRVAIEFSPDAKRVVEAIVSADGLAAITSDRRPAQGRGPEGRRHRHHALDHRRLQVLRHRHRAEAGELLPGPVRHRARPARPLLAGSVLRQDQPDRQRCLRLVRAAAAAVVLRHHRRVRQQGREPRPAVQGLRRRRRRDGDLHRRPGHQHDVQRRPRRLRLGRQRLRHPRRQQQVHPQYLEPAVVVQQPRAAVARDGPRLRPAAFRQFRRRQRHLRQSLGRAERRLEQCRSECDLWQPAQAHQCPAARAPGLDRCGAQADRAGRRRRATRCSSISPAWPVPATCR